ncbi:unnamed protein product [Clonostachys byssicola]|uniref:AB hydrolase-1 domain-containing protein n=1 Tax=Clonostachys byssicola TaxID=160290 RepID=A0A9N9U2H0_9HYPO|nr:unnamed protein product [Clonostachys byssicola]
MTANTQPSIIVIPGAWHLASCLDPFIETLQAAGFPAEGVTLRSVGDADADISDDEALLRSRIESRIHAGEDVIVIAHSYAGLPMSAAIDGLSKRNRASRGEKGGVLGVVYLAAFVPFDGESVFGLLGNPLWWMEDDVSFALLVFTPLHLYSPLLAKTEARVIKVKANAPPEAFFHDCSPKQIAVVSGALKPHSKKSLTSPITTIGWRDSAYDGCRAYIRCSQDKALLIEVQDMFVERSGVQWVVKTLDSSHSPFISMPRELTVAVQEIARDFRAAV